MSLTLLERTRRKIAECDIQATNIVPAGNPKNLGSRGRGKAAKKKPAAKKSAAAKKPTANTAALADTSGNQATKVAKESKPAPAPAFDGSRRSTRKRS
jgi:hypothetical protein